MIRLFLAGSAAAAIVVALSGCSAPACGTGAAGAETAVAGLISAARTADSPDDLCTFIATAYDVSDQDLADLQTRFAGHPDDELDFRLTGQLGSTAQVIVTDNGISERFDVTSDSDSRWTVAFGTLFG